MYRILFLIGIGSVVGGIARFLTQQYVQRNYPSIIPLGTLGVNIIGCFLIGLVYGLAQKGNILSEEMRLFLATGICGGFTTFSAFAYENIALLQDGEFFYTAAYVTMSVILGLASVYLGIFFIKMF